MKCALVIPSWIPEEIFSSKTAGSQINYWQPLGTLYVASSILKSGHDVIFLELLLLRLVASALVIIFELGEYRLLLFLLFLLLLFLYLLFIFLFLG